MKANIIVQNLSKSGAVQAILKKVSSIPGLSEINIEPERSRISFNYQTDEAVFSLFRILKNLGHPFIASRHSKNDKTNNKVLT